ncbi:uncharacterized protein B0I36DRAFT_411291 [Microdochium trichocladiopsis]|uniref:DUF1917-domain-containing protein n=1 Tax=Microdochium trichocladiopsis TaxID=1682393 RepID=A0A9P8Y763_9PEZI|nr:uncharacterized protein B0I36DRAFT_411291 [Microdochium trichocladiopsis]KAH7029391.1 hypothetical protein B0I36DRAFT_411291 [Microdochium trichocladiopsis]
MTPFRNMEYSDDSDFYGDENEQALLHRRVDQADLSSWWRLHTKVSSPIKQHHTARPLATMSHFHNPYAGVPYAWQLTETVIDFLHRLPPSTTEGFPWIYICNPYVDRRPRVPTSCGANVVGCEDEGPQDNGADVATLMQGGMERLHMISEFIDYLRRIDRPPELKMQELRKASSDASEDILTLAQHLRVTCGKWMLFCPVAEVDAVWELIAKATANNELGIAAKVAPKSSTDSRAERLICVYTADFSNKQDIKRVAVNLQRLGLISPTGRPVYYKPDAYTYLGISSQNPWNIRASIYNSTTVLREW